MPRFFVAPDRIQGSRIVLEGGEFRHAVRVMRLRAGDSITVIDGEGREYLARIESVTDRCCTASVVSSSSSAGTPVRELRLYQSFIKVPRFEMILEKATELGVTAIVPVQSRRSAPVELGAERRNRWERILKSASCQCGRNDIPRLEHPLAFAEALQCCEGPGALILSPSAAVRRLSLPGTGPLALLLGPEGGFADDEMEQARACGLQEISLGPRVLRAETAALAALAILVHEMENMA